jgi:arylsulfatase A-like enzyme
VRRNLGEGTVCEGVVCEGIAREGIVREGPGVRFGLLIGWLVGSASALLILGCGGAPPAARPNIVLVSMDTLRADHLGLYGYRRNTSPQLEALARESVVFERAISSASATQPSHASLYQSRLSSHSNVRAQVLPEVLRSNGYRTAGFTGGGNVSARFGFGRGFEVYEEDRGGFAKSFPKLERWLRSNTDRPFFIFFHSFDIHHPYDVVSPYDKIFYPGYKGEVTGPKTLYILSRIRKIYPSKGFEGQVELTEQDKAKIIALYDGGILFADQYVGRLVALLKQLDVWENTILVVLSDHGEEFWEHGNVTHSHTVYTEVLHVPLVWHLPGSVHAGMRVARPVRLMDVAPSLLELAGLPIPESFRGRSLLPFELLDSSPEAESIVSEMHTLKSLIEYPWKIIKEYPDGRHFLAEEPLALYNLETDPGETVNLAAELPEEVVRLEASLAVQIAAAEQRPVRDVPLVVEDDELRSQLQALGYAVEAPGDD